MVGILLITHNGLGDSLIDCVRHVMGSVPPHLKALSVLANDDPVRKEEEGRALIAQLDKGRGVLLLSDCVRCHALQHRTAAVRDGPHRRCGRSQPADAAARGLLLQQTAGRAGATRTGRRQRMYRFS